MFNIQTLPSDADLATQTLTEESAYRFPAFSANDAVTLGLTIRKRFRASTRHAKGKGMVISVQTLGGHTLFACTVGEGSLDSWAYVEAMVRVVKKTGHSSFYVEKGMSAMGRDAKEHDPLGDVSVCGGAFPIWLDSFPTCPVAVVACFSGSSQEDHTLAMTSIRDYLNKLRRTAGTDARATTSTQPEPAHPVPHRDSGSEWVTEADPREFGDHTESRYSDL